MSKEEADYFERRAEAEIALAQQAEHGCVVQVHYELATAYLDRIYGQTSQPEQEFPLAEQDSSGSGRA